MSQADADPVAELASALALSDSFQFHVLTAPGPAALDAALVRLTRPIRRLRGPRGADFHALVRAVLEPLLEAAPDDAVRILDATGAEPDEERAWEELFRRLNEVRNAVVARSSAPLLLAVTPALADVFALVAPDFWSIRSEYLELPDVDAPTGALAGVWKLAEQVPPEAPLWTPPEWNVPPRPLEEAVTNPTQHLTRAREWIQHGDALLTWERAAEAGEVYQRVATELAGATIGALRLEEARALRRLAWVELRAGSESVAKELAERAWKGLRGVSKEFASPWPDFSTAQDEIRLAWFGDRALSGRWEKHPGGLGNLGVASLPAETWSVYATLLLSRAADARARGATDRAESWLRALRPSFLPARGPAQLNRYVTVVIVNTALAELRHRQGHPTSPLPRADALAGLPLPLPPLLQRLSAILTTAGV